ncbi:hypothetical protein PHMEG_00021075, partial [Phytophthora megakarya]
KCRYRLLSMKRSRTKIRLNILRKMAPTSSCRQWLGRFSRIGIIDLATSSSM